MIFQEVKIYGRFKDGKFEENKDNLPEGDSREICTIFINLYTGNDQDFKEESSESKQEEDKTNQKSDEIEKQDDIESKIKDSKIINLNNR